MAKIYFVRHQAAGVLWQFPFSAPLTDAQLVAVGELCFQAHGDTHPKTGERYWINGIAVEVLSPSDVPEVPERSLSVANEAGMPEIKVEATGHVENP